MQAYAGTYDLQLFYRPLAFCTPSASGNPFLNAHRVQSDVAFTKILTRCYALAGLRLTAYFRYIIMPGSRLLSHAVSSIVPSAARIFTVVFGMGTGVPSARITTRQNLSVFSNLPRKHTMLRPPGSRIAASIRIPTVLRTAPCSCPYVRQGLTNAHARMAFAQLFLTVFAHMRT